MSDAPEEGHDLTMSMRTKVIAGVVGALLVLGVVWLSLRMASPLIADGATPPTGHYALPCGVCHRVGAAVAK